MLAIFIAFLSPLSVLAEKDSKIVGPVIGIDLGTTYRYGFCCLVLLAYRY